MLHIAIICKTFLKGGAEKQALILSKLLTEKKIDVCLINWYRDKVDPENLKYIEDNSFKYFALKGSLLKKFFHFLKIIRDERISVVLSYLTLSNFVSGVSKLFLRKIITIGGIRNEKLPFYKFLFEKWIHNKLNDATVFNNFSAKNKFIKRGFKSDKIFVIHNAIELAPMIINTKAPKYEIRIITVSRFVKQKDFRTALNSFKNLIDRCENKPLSYYIVGYGPLEQEIRSLAEDLKILNRVRILINPPNIPEILKDCDIFLSTSLFEGLSNSIMEAMVAGLPVVATDVGDNKYLIKDGFNGYLVPSKGINQIVEKLEYLSESEDIRREFGNNSRIKIGNDFSQEKLLKNYLNLFSELHQS